MKVKASDVDRLVRHRASGKKAVIVGLDVAVENGVHISDDLGEFMTIGAEVLEPCSGRSDRLALSMICGNVIIGLAAIGVVGCVLLEVLRLVL